MSMDAPSSVSIQTSAEPIPSMPEWFGEVALIAHTLTRLSLLSEICERVSHRATARIAGVVGRSREPSAAESGIDPGCDTQGTHVLWSRFAGAEQRLQLACEIR